jgi:hypothetical protein
MVETSTSSSLVSILSKGVVERPPLDVPKWKKHPTKAIMNHIHQEIMSKSRQNSERADRVTTHQHHFVAQTNDSPKSSLSSWEKISSHLTSQLSSSQKQDQVERNISTRMHNIRGRVSEPSSRDPMNTVAMKDHGNLSKKSVMSKFRNPFKLKTTQKAHENEHEDAGKTRDNLARSKMNMTSQSNGMKESDGQRLGKRSARLYKNSTTFTYDHSSEDIDEYLSSSLSSHDSVLNIGSIFNAEQEPPKPKTSHAQSSEPEGSFKVIPPRPLSDTRFLSNPAQSTLIARKKPVLTEEIRVQIRTPEGFPAETRSQAASIPRDRIANQIPRRSGLFTWTAPTTGPPPELPPLPSNKRSTVQMTVVESYTAGKGHDSESTVSYVSLPLHYASENRDLYTGGVKTTSSGYGSGRSDAARESRRIGHQDHSCGSAGNESSMTESDDISESFVESDSESIALNNGAISNALKKRRARRSTEGISRVSIPERYRRQERRKLWLG